MYLLMDENGVVRGRTTDTVLVHPLKDALEAICGYKLTICEVLEFSNEGVHIYE